MFCSEFPGRYRMPAEWEPHLATYVVWPHNEATWPECLKEAQQAMALIAAALSRSEQVRILVKSPELQDQAMEMTAKLGAELSRIAWLRIVTSDSWIRDYGPIFVNSLAEATEETPPQIGLKWRFNAWGGKYEGYEADDAAALHLSSLYGFPLYKVDFVLEGGAIDGNGKGTLLTTETCLLNPNRNGSLARRDITERYLKRYLGVGTVIWLTGEIAGDDTDGHVDQVARFVAEDTIVAMVESNRADENYNSLRENLLRLKAARGPDGRPFVIETLQMPKPRFYKGIRLPASYANFYIANSCVLVPLFDCKEDYTAVELFTRLFPGRDIVGIPAFYLAVGLGTVHCLTMQHPAPYKT